MRFFRCLAGDERYEEVRLSLDAAWGHPTPDGRIVTCIDPAAVAPRDQQGRIVLAVPEAFTQFSVAADLLPQLLAAGVVEEIDEATYRAAISQTV